MTKECAFFIFLPYSPLFCLTLFYFSHSLLLSLWTPYFPSLHLSPSFAVLHPLLPSSSICIKDLHFKLCELKILKLSDITQIFFVTIDNSLTLCILWCNLKINRVILVRFQHKPFSISVIQVYIPQPLIMKKLKSNGSVKTYKNF